MIRLVDRVCRFQRECRKRHDTHFLKLAREGQHLHTLFITYSKARGMAHLITQSTMGKWFMARDGNNIVPSAMQTAHHFTLAANQHAVDVLKVGDVVGAA